MHKGFHDWRSGPSPMRSIGGTKRLPYVETAHWTSFERWVVRVALAAAPMMVVGFIVAMFVSPHQLAESDTATGWGLWLGAALGVAMAPVFYVLPQLLFGLALRSPTRERLTATAIASPVWVFLGLQGVLVGLIDGWAGVAPVAVVTAAAAAVLDCFVCVVAWRARRRLTHHQTNRTVIHHT